MRPRTLDEFVGQTHLLTAGSPLRVLIENDALISMILWGQTGSGNTSLSSIVAVSNVARYVVLLAV